MRRLRKRGFCEGGDTGRGAEGKATGKRKREDEEKETGQGFQDDELREFGDRCFNYYGYHRMGHWCKGVATKSDNLNCLDGRRAHSFRACFALMKRCQHPVCGGQRGHIEKAHKRLLRHGEAEQENILRKRRTG